ncbi:MAG: hypothetical protein K0S07_1169 [Chlamydiales bacterium]|jgi:hypothetical protein|nr:hypothetical protein [Chlamydiales bacterium]
MNYLNSIKFKQDNLNFLTRSLNKVGNLFLTPVRYTLGGRTGTCFLIPNDRHFIPCRGSFYTSKDFYANIAEKKHNLVKTALSLSLFVPSLILGAAIKAPALIFSERLRRRHNTFGNIKSLESKAYNELRIGIISRKEKRINNFLKYVDQINEPEKFFNELQSGKAIFTGSVFQSISAEDLIKLMNEEITPKEFLNLYQ